MIYIERKSDWRSDFSDGSRRFRRLNKIPPSDFSSAPTLFEVAKPNDVGEDRGKNGLGEQETGALRTEQWHHHRQDNKLGRHHHFSSRPRCPRWWLRLLDSILYPIWLHLRSLIRFLILLLLLGRRKSRWCGAWLRFPGIVSRMCSR